MASAPKFYDRVQESSTTTGTGTYTLAGAITGFQSFAAVGDGNSCYYCAQEVDANGNPSGGWEVGLGTYTASGTTLSRDTILASSNANAAVSWAAGTRRIFLCAPAAFADFGAIQTTEIAITGTATATLGRWHLCSGTSADYTVTLPTAVGHAGQHIGFRMAPFASLSKLVTLDANSTETIDGALTRILWAGESCLLRSDGANWFKVAGVTIPMAAFMALNSGQNLSHNTMTDVALDDTINDNTGAMADIANNRINILRPSRYQIFAEAVILILSADAGRVISQISGSINGAAQAQITTAEGFGKNGSFPAPIAVAELQLYSGDWIKMAGYQNSGLTQAFFGAYPGGPNLVVSEKVTW